MRKFLTPLLVLATSAQIIFTGPADAAIWKTFEGLETGLVLLQPDMGTTELQQAGQSLLKNIGDSELTFLSQPLAELEKKLGPELRSHQGVINQALKPYTLSSPRYEYIESNLALALQSNQVVQKSYFINEALKANRNLLPRLEAQLQTNNLSGHDRAALGVASFALGYFTLRALEKGKVLPGEIDRLQTELGAKLNSVQTQISANPFRAMELGAELQFLLEAQGISGRLSKTTAQSLGDLPQSAQSLAKLVTSVNKLF